MKNNRYVNFLPYLLVLGVLLMLGSFSMGSQQRTFSYNEFTAQASKMKFGDVNISVGTSIIKVEGIYQTKDGKRQFDVTMPKTTKNLEWLSETLDEKNNQVEVRDADERNILVDFMLQIVPMLVVVGIFAFILMKSGGGGNNKAFEFTKSRARIEQNIKTRFADVAGCKEEKEEVKEIIDYLKNPGKFSEMGARIPKGMLMVGPPGTGKTLLAKAVAGEAGVPFFSISGSDFVEMFVGTGASRVRDMFKRAKQSKPCIVFIDEIDAVGRQRGAGLGGGNDEREQTLNQLLVEMDGMNENSGIVVIAATNRSDVLDPALMRSGRFDRQITVGLPDKSGRQEILEVHARNKKLAPNVNLEQLAKRTQGFSGADLENVLNEGAILAVREDRHLITMNDLDEAIDRVMMGPAKKSKKYTEKEKRMVAYHEAGHAVIGLKLEGANSVQKITIIPRGQAGGYNLMTKEEETYCTTKTEYMSTITSYLGGRVSEEVVFNEITDGAYGDLEQVTKIAKAMVRSFGMSKLGPIQYSDNSGNVFLGRDYSQGNNYSGEIAFEIDKEIRRIVNECYEQAKQIIIANRDLLDLIANTLIEEETITAEQIRNLAEFGRLKTPEEMEAEAKTKELEEAEANRLKQEENDAVEQQITETFGAGWIEADENPVAKEEEKE